MRLKIKVFSLLIFSFFIHSNEIEEIVVTGTLLKNAESDLSPVQLINENDYKKLNNTDIPKGTIHGDLFPDNVLFNKNNQITGFLDFYFSDFSYFYTWCLF